MGHQQLTIKRKAAKKAKAKEDPYYLYDEKDADADDLDDIPIVRLDDLPEGESATIPCRSLRLMKPDQTIDQLAEPDKPKSKKKPKPPPPQFDRSGEMPEDANPDPANQPEAEIAKGLAGVDLRSDNLDSRPTSTSKFEEYNVGDDEPRRTDLADEPVNVGGEIEVVKVKRKKKKDGSKKRTEA